MSEHTPVPWESIRLMNCWAIRVAPESWPHEVSRPDNRICTLFDHVEYEGKPCGSIQSQDKTNDEIKANAAFIVRACNAHDDLMEACTAFVDYYTQAGIGDCLEGHDDDPSDDGFDGDERFNVRAGRAAIAKAEEKKL